jgi:hypothetical protein
VDVLLNKILLGGAVISLDLGPISSLISINASAEAVVTQGRNIAPLDAAHLQSLIGQNVVINDQTDAPLRHKKHEWPMPKAL